VPKELGALQHVSINEANKLVAKPALLLRRPVPACIAKHQTSAKFDGTDQEEVNPKLATIFHKFRDKPGKSRFNAALTLYTRLLPLLFCQQPITLLLVYNQSSRPCYWA
jgi:hypothetical protein